MFKALGSTHPALARDSWHLLVTMRKTELNKNIAREIFDEFIRRYNKNICELIAIQSLAEYLVEDMKEGFFTHEKIVGDLILRV